MSEWLVHEIADWIVRKLERKTALTEKEIIHAAWYKYEKMDVREVLAAMDDLCMVEKTTTPDRKKIVYSLPSYRSFDWCI